MIITAVFVLFAAVLLADGALTRMLWRPAITQMWRIVLGAAAVGCAAVATISFRQAATPLKLWEAGAAGVRNHVDYLGQWHEGVWIPWRAIRKLELKRELSGDSRLPVIWLHVDDASTAGPLISAIKPQPEDPAMALLANGDPAGEQALALLQSLQEQHRH